MTTRDEPDEPMRRRWRARFAAVHDALANDEDADALELLRKALRRRRGPADVDAVVRWAFATHEEAEIPAGERALVDDLVAACLLAYPGETTAALLGGLRGDGPSWLIALLGASTHADVGSALVDKVDRSALDEDGLVVLLEALHARAERGDDVARAFLTDLDEAPLPRKAKGALRTARFRLGRRSP